MLKMARKFFRSAGAAGMTEYGMALALVGVVSLAAVTSTGDEVERIFGDLGNDVGNVRSSAFAGSGGPGSNPDQQGSEDGEFIFLTNVSDAEISTLFSETLVAPASADGKTLAVTGDASCAASINFGTDVVSAVLADGDIIEIKATSSEAYETEVTCSLSAGAETKSWTIKTKVDDLPDAMNFVDATSGPGQAVTSNAIVLSGFTASLPASLGNDAEAVLVINGADSGNSATVQPGDSLAIRTVASSTFGTQKIPSLTVGAGSTSWSVMTGVDPNTVMLLSFNGDASDLTGNYAPSSNGAAISYNAGKFEQSVRLPSMTSISIPDDTKWSSGDRTFEGWFKIAQVTGGNVTLFGQSAAYADRNWFCYVYGDASVACGINGKNEFVTPAGMLPIGGTTWRHLALTIKADGTARLYINGQVQGYGSGTNFNDSPNEFTIGSGVSGNNGDIHVDDFRVSDVIRYTGNFTPPAAPLN